MVVGSMVGAGIFSLPGRFGAATGPFGALIAWAIAGGGMLMLAFVFQFLAERKPDLDSGIFAYARPASATISGLPRPSASGQGPASATSRISS
jgi:arginine:ornithine antiporter / lysine permease